MVDWIKKIYFSRKFKRIETIAIIASILLCVYFVYHYKLSFGKCVIYSQTGILCPGCGGTRAFHSLLQGNFAEALEHNLLIPLYVVFLLALPSGYLYYRHTGKFPLLRLASRLWLWLGFLAVILVYTLLRNII